MCIIIYDILESKQLHGITTQWKCILAELVTHAQVCIIS